MVILNDISKNCNGRLLKTGMGTKILTLLRLQKQVLLGSWP